MRKTDKKRTTVKDIAREAGVSTALVSFVMSNEYGNGNYRVCPETTKRILELAKELDYHPNTYARTLKSGRSNTIGVIFSDISNPFFAEIARLIEDEAFKRGYSVLFGSTDESAEKMKRLVDALLSKGVDGMIVVPCSGSDGIVSSINGSGMPVVLLDRDVKDVSIPSVLLDNAQSSYALTENLFEKGYSHIEMISYSMPLSNIIDREAGYLNCMSVHGVGDSARIHKSGYLFDKAWFDSVIADAKARGVGAFVFATNTLATQGIFSMISSGFRIPEDFGISTFDKNESFDYFSTGITYALQPLAQFTTESMRMLFKLIGRETLPPEDIKVILQPTIIDCSEHQNIKKQ